MHKSIWTDTVKTQNHKKLKENIKTDVLVIGGGLCGLLCAYFLKNAGFDCAIAEGQKPASGTTQNTTAKITSQHRLIYSDLVKSVGVSNARLYFEAHQSAIKDYERICKNIDCDFENKPSYIYSRSDQRKIEDEINALNKMGINAEFKKETELPFCIAGAVCFENQAQFNPLKFINEISKGLDIYEDTFIDEIKPGKAITKNGNINFTYAIVATHFPFINTHGAYFLKLYQERSYVSAYKNAQKLNGMYLDEAKDGMSLRTYNDALLIGGNSHRTGKKSSAWEPLDEFAKKYYPDAELICRWAAQDCMSLDGIAYIGEYSKNMKNIYVATGFNKWGMTSSMLSAQMLTDMIKGVKRDYHSLFSPQRSMLKPQLAINSFEAMCNLAMPKTKRCSHLGCALKWNKNEHSWDCSCHGSRFDKNGNVLENPAMRNLK